MLLTCNKYQKTYYCKHCAHKVDCYWMTSIQMTSIHWKTQTKRLACESWEGDHYYDDCRQLKPKQRRISET